MNDVMTRDVRLTIDHMYWGRHALSLRVRELERRLKKTSYAGKPGMLKSVLWELETLKEFRDILDHNHTAAARAFGDRILSAEKEV